MTDAPPPSRGAAAAQPRTAASAFFLAHRSALIAAAARGPILDLACGRGRHALAAAELGLHTIGLDRNAGFLSELRATAASRALPLGCVRADLEAGCAPPIAPGRCGAVLVFRYLHRPLAKTIAALLAPGGLLLYETFTVRQRALGGGPKSGDFLLDEGELPSLFRQLDVVCSEEVETRGDSPAAVARLAAIKPAV